MVVFSIDHLYGWQAGWNLIVVVGKNSERFIGPERLIVIIVILVGIYFYIDDEDKKAQESIVSNSFVMKVDETQHDLLTKKRTMEAIKQLRGTEQYARVAEEALRRDRSSAGRGNTSSRMNSQMRSNSRAMNDE